MSLTLVYIGAAAGLAPAASLRALAGGGAVLVPPDVDPELRGLVAEAAGLGVREPQIVDSAVAGAGPHSRFRGGTESGTEFGTGVHRDTSGTGSGAGDRAGCGDRSAGGADSARIVGVPARFGVGDLIRRAATEVIVVALAGSEGPQLARELRRAAESTNVSIETVPSRQAFDDALLAQELVSLKRIVDVLRVECPWDREQTPRDIVGYTIEEVHELADAIAAGDLEAEHGELGDLLLQVVLLALMLSEEGAGDLASVARDIELKLIRRHPHIFADAVAETPAAVKRRWERIKVEQEGREGIFHDVPSGFPALLYAKKLQQRASAVGFDWSSAAAAFPKIAEEHGELGELFAEAASVAGHVEAGAEPADAAPPASDPQRSDPHRSDPRVTHELGDLLFATVNVARLLHVDPELALREAGVRFKRRVLAAAELAATEGHDWAALDWPEQEDYYQRAKAGSSATGTHTE